MIIDLNDNGERFTEEKFNKFFSLIETGTAFSGVPLEFRDQGELIDLQEVDNYIKKVRTLDKLGYIPIIIVLDSHIVYTPEFSQKLEYICASYMNIFVKIETEDNFNTENIRSVIENYKLSNKLVFEYKIKSNEFSIDKHISTLFKHTSNNHLILSIDNTKKYDYKKLAESIINTNKIRRKRIIALEFGCGFPSCMFNNEQIGDLFRTPMMGINFFCKPKAVVKPNLDIYYCEHPGSFKLTVDSVKSIKDLYEQFDIVREQRDNFLYDDCETCWFNEKMCSGGCYLNK
jgi:radical SAM protein with 4Fe4S-binding SPASM domain